MDVLTAGAVTDDLPRPLGRLADLVTVLADCSGDRRDIALQRLLDETRTSGSNVRREFEARGLTPHVWSDGMAEFYRTSTGFLYETAVWNCSALKRSMRQWMGNFLSECLPANSRVLVTGDGLGFDSACLAGLGFQVTALDPSERGRRFAERVFALNHVVVQQAASEEHLSGERFDAVVCLDVLEHLPSPPETLAKLNQLLNASGLLVVSAPFFCVEPFRPTHLASNLCYSGSLRLFREAGFEPFAGRCLWSPIVFRKGIAGKLRRRLAVHFGQPVLMAGRWLSPVYSRVARWMLKSDTERLSEIATLQRSESACSSVGQRRSALCVASQTTH